MGAAETVVEHFLRQEAYWKYKWAKTDGLTLWLYEHPIAAWFKPGENPVQVYRTDGYRLHEWNGRERNALTRQRISSGNSHPLYEAYTRLFVSNGGSYRIDNALRGHWRYGWSTHLTARYLELLGVQAYPMNVRQNVIRRTNYGDSWRTLGQRSIPDFMSIYCVLERGFFSRPSHIVNDLDKDENESKVQSASLPWSGEWIEVFPIPHRTQWGYKRSVKREWSAYDVKDHGPNGDLISRPARPGEQLPPGALDYRWGWYEEIEQPMYVQNELRRYPNEKPPLGDYEDARKEAEEYAKEHAAELRAERKRERDAQRALIESEQLKGWR